MRSRSLSVRWCARLLLIPILSCLLDSALAQQGPQFGVRPLLPDLFRTTGPTVEVELLLENFTGEVMVTFTRDDGASSTQSRLGNGTSRMKLDLSDLSTQDERLIRYRATAVAPESGEIVHLPQACVILLDNLAPRAPVLSSPQFPASADGDVLLVRGSVSRASGRPEVGGRVVCYSFDRPQAVGAGVIRANGSFVLAIDLSEEPVGEALPLGLVAEDTTGNQSEVLTVTVERLRAR